MVPMVAPGKLGRIVAWTMTALSVAPFWWGCRKTSVTLSRGGSASFTITGISKVMAAPGETLTLTGTGLSPDLQLTAKMVTDSAAQPLSGTVKVLDATSATYQLPSNAPFGALSLTASQGDAKQTVTIFSTGGKSDYPIIPLPIDQVCSGTKYYDATGVLTTGTKSCVAPSTPICSSDGVVGCVTTAAFKAADLSQAVAAKIMTGTTIAGVAGTLASCTTDGQTGCAAVASYPAAKLANITAANVKSGTTIAGVAGALADCTTDGQTNCVTSAALPAAAITGFSTWNLRIGTTLAGLSGALKTNCRNTVNSTYYNWDGAIGSLPTTSETGGTQNDMWDTVDDWYGFSTATVSGWSSNTLCDSTTWTDVTTTDGGSTTTTCAASSANCQYRDNITNLVVTKNITSIDWAGAIQTCNSSTYGGFSAGTWRLPTQKEVLSLYEHGIVSLASAAFITLATMQGTYFWSSVTSGVNTSFAFWVRLANGTSATNGGKTSSNSVLCVR